MTFAGGRASRSGLKSGNCPIPSKIDTLISGGASSAVARNNMELMDAALKLPERPRIFTAATQPRSHAALSISSGVTCVPRDCIVWAILADRAFQRARPAASALISRPKPGTASQVIRVALGDRCIQRQEARRLAVELYCQKFALQCQTMQDPQRLAMAAS